MLCIRVRKLMFSAVLAATSFASAAGPVTDTVIIGDKEWAQPNLFNGLTFDYIKLVVCPEVACTGTVRYPDGGPSFDMDGWTWASVAEVRELFQAITPLQDEEYYAEIAIFPWANEVFDLHGFAPNYDDGVLRILSGMTSDVGLPGADIYDSFAAQASIWAHYEELSYDPVEDIFRTNIDEIRIGTIEGGFESGAWFYRDVVADVPEPGSFALLCAGLLGIRIRRFTGTFNP